MEGLADDGAGGSAESRVDNSGLADSSSSLGTAND